MKTIFTINILIFLSVFSLKAQNKIHDFEYLTEYELLEWAMDSESELLPQDALKANHGIPGEQKLSSVRKMNQKSLEHERRHKLFQNSSSRYFSKKITAKSTTINGKRLDSISMSSSEIVAVGSWGNDAIEKEEVTLDLKGNPILKIVKKENPQAGSLLNYSKTMYSRNDSGQVLTETFSVWDSINKAWVNSTNQVYEFDESGNIILSSRYVWDFEFDSWKGIMKVETSYYISGQIENIIRWQWSEDLRKWIINTRKKYELDDKGRITFIFNSDWNEDQNSWVSHSKDVYNYDSDSLQILTHWLWDNETEKWEKYRKSVTMYNLLANSDSTISYLWNNNQGDWVKSIVYKKTYDETGTLLSILSFFFDQSGNLTNSSFNWWWVYSESGKTLQSSRSSWNVEMNEWQPNQTQERKYDESDNLIYNKSESWISGLYSCNVSVYNRNDIGQLIERIDSALVREQWALKKKSNYIYDESGNLIEELVDEYDDNLYRTSREKKVFKFNDRNLQIGYEKYDWIFTDSVDYRYYTLEYMYNESNKIEEIASRDVNSKGDTLFRGIQFFYYDEQGRDTLVLENWLSEELGVMESAFKTRKSYNSIGWLIAEEQYEWYSNRKAWQYNYRDEYSYNDENEINQILRYSWAEPDSTWILSGKYDYQYNSQNQLEKIVEYSKNNESSWKLSGESRLSYTDFGRIKLSQEYWWDSSKSEWNNRSKTEYEYTAGRQLREEVYSEFSYQTQTWIFEDKTLYKYDAAYPLSSLVVPSIYSKLFNDGMLIEYSYLSWDRSLNEWEVEEGEFNVYYSDVDIALNMPEAGHVVQKTLNIYPNPVSQRLNIENTFSEELRIELIDLCGKILVQMKGITQKVSLDVSNLETGTYIIRVSLKNGGEDIIQKFTKL